MFIKMIVDNQGEKEADEVMIDQTAIALYDTIDCLHGRRNWSCNMCVM